MIFILAGIAVALTYAMFAYKESMLGFPSGIFWALLGGHAYTLSTALWDMEYFVFIASLVGMFPFCIYAAFAVRKRDLSPIEEDWDDSGKYIDEKGKSEKPVTKKGTDKDTDDVMTEAEKDSDMGEKNPPSEFYKGWRERMEQRRRERRIMRKADWH